MRFTERLLLAILMVPTVAIIAAALIVLMGDPGAPAEPGVKPTPAAYYYSEMEIQP